MAPAIQSLFCPKKLRLVGRTAVLSLLASCIVTPLSGKLRPGADAMVIVVGQGADDATELFAAPAEGGKFIQITFNRWAEDLPRLSPTGTKLAFVREPTGTDLGDRLLVVMDLITMIEKITPLPASRGAISRLGWSAGGDTVFVGTKEPLATAIRDELDLELVPSERLGAVEDRLNQVLGEPPFAVIKACRAGGICAVAGDTLETPLGAGASDAIRWGPDAVAYFIDGSLEIRPLAAGRPRRPKWTGLPTNPRRPTHHPGAGRAPNNQ